MLGRINTHFPKWLAGIVLGKDKQALTEVVSRHCVGEG